MEIGSELFERTYFAYTHELTFDLVRMDSEIRKLYQIDQSESMSDYLKRLFPNDFEKIK